MVINILEAFVIAIANYKRKNLLNLFGIIERMADNDFLSSKLLDDEKYFNQTNKMICSLVGKLTVISYDERDPLVRRREMFVTSDQDLASLMGCLSSFVKALPSHRHPYYDTVLQDCAFLIDYNVNQSEVRISFLL